MIAIVGATGYIGRYLCPYLQKKGYDVLALGRSKKVFDFFDTQNVKHQYFDINDVDSFKSLPLNIDVIVDLSACLAEHETPVSKFFEINTIGVYKLLEYCKKNDIKKFVLASSHKVYNDVQKLVISENDTISFRGDHSPYIISKIAAENFVDYFNKDFGMNGIALRLTGVRGYGEILGHLDIDGTYHKSALEIYFENALKGLPIEVWGNQSKKRDHVYIKDVLSAFECAINSNETKGVFNIASGVGYSQFDEANAIAEVFKTNKKSEILLFPEKQGLSRGYIYDISKAKKMLQWNPQYTDLINMYEDYKIEWKIKLYKNYHFIKTGQEPMTL